VKGGSLIWRGLSAHAGFCDQEPGGLLGNTRLLKQP